MTWTTTDALTLASNSCSFCQGTGMVTGMRGRSTPCQCVYRAVFRACYRKFVECATKEKHMTRATYTLVHGPRNIYSWGRKEEEYVADFCLVSKRTLSEDDYRIFRYHFLLGADWKLCCRKLALQRGRFFHAVYRIQAKLGKTFRELKPYALYPLDEYFEYAVHPELPPSSTLSTVRAKLAHRRPLRPPLPKAA